MSIVSRTMRPVSIYQSSNIAQRSKSIFGIVFFVSMSLGN